MAIRFCDDPTPHAAHRWPYAGTTGLREEYCLGQHAASEGEWLSALHRRGDRRKAHFFLEDSVRSVCGYGHKDQGQLPFDPAVGATTEPDPRLREPRFRTVCDHCRRAISQAV